MSGAFFLLSEVAGALLRVELWGFALLVLAWLALRRGRLAQARHLLAGLIVGALVVAVLPLGSWLLAPLEARFPAAPALERVDGILVPGGAEDMAATGRWGGAQLGEAGERLAAAAMLARRFPEARVVLLGSGGRLRDGAGRSGPAEAEVAARFLAAQGIAPGRLLAETGSRNTAENARLGLALADPRPEETWVLVTSAFHMPRALPRFAAEGWPGLVAWPVDFRSTGLADGIGWEPARNLALLNLAIREWVALAAYRLAAP